MASLGGGQGSRRFVTVVNGKLAERVAKNTEGAVERTNKNGKVIYEKYHSQVSGKISKLELRSKEFEGKTYESVNITFDDEIQLQLSGNIDNMINKSIINTLLSEGCDLSKELVFIATKDDEGFSSVFIMQDGKGIKRYSTKDHPNGVPQPKKTTALGKTVWNWDEQNEWYFQKFQSLAKKIEELQKNKPEETIVDDIFS